MRNLKLEDLTPIHDTGNGTLVNEFKSIIMGENIKSLGYNKALAVCKRFGNLDDDMLWKKYPHYMKLKKTFGLKKPTAYYYAKDLPLFVEMDDRAYLIAPAVESMDDLNKAIEDVLKGQSRIK